MRGNNHLDRDDIYEYESHEDYLEKISFADPFFANAKEEIKKFFNNNREVVLYMRQLQLKYEKEYYHWITHNAVANLSKEGHLKQIDVKVSALGNPLHLHFFTHPTNRYPKRKINKVAKLVAEYSQDHITSSCGNRTEILFAEGLASRGFVIEGKEAKEYKGKYWTLTGHDLDYIFQRDGISYGCEIKNTLAYIDKGELEIKLEMCKHLSLVPLFIMRYSPKTYNKMIIDRGGFALLFKAQIYDISQIKLVERIKKTLGYEVICPRAIQEGTIKRFENWHNRRIKM